MFKIVTFIFASFHLVQPLSLLALLTYYLSFSFNQPFVTVRVTKQTNNQFEFFTNPFSTLFSSLFSDSRNIHSCAFSLFLWPSLSSNLSGFSSSLTISRYEIVESTDWGVKSVAHEGDIDQGTSFRNYPRAEEVEDGKVTKSGYNWTGAIGMLLKRVSGHPHPSLFLPPFLWCSRTEF